MSTRRTKLAQVLLLTDRKKNRGPWRYQQSVQGRLQNRFVGERSFFTRTRRHEFSSRGTSIEGSSCRLEEDGLVIEDEQRGQLGSEVEGAHSSQVTQKDIDDADSQGRLWLDPSIKLSDRVNRFLIQETGSLHSLDVTLQSVDLIRECGQLGTFEGMENAHEILGKPKVS